VAAHVLLGALIEHEIRERGERTVVASLVHGGAARGRLVGHREARAVHSERPEDALFHHFAEAFAAHALDDFADPVDVRAVLPLLAGVEEEDRVERSLGRRHDARDAALLAVVYEVVVEEIVAESSRVEHELPDGDVGLRGAGSRLAIVVEAVENLNVGESRRVLLRWIFEGYFPLLHELHDGDARYRLRA